MSKSISDIIAGTSVEEKGYFEWYSWNTAGTVIFILGSY